MSNFNIEDMRRMHWAQPVEQQTRDDIANMTDEQRMLEQWLNADVGCEGATHPDGRNGHQAHLPAEFRVGFDCGHEQNMCRGWVLRSMACAGSYCLCGEVTDAERLTVRPI